MGTKHYHDVQPHSQHSKEYLVFSGHESCFPEHYNTNRALSLADAMKFRGVAFKALKGCYNGQEEFSFIVENTPENLKMVQNYCKRFNQECYMKLGVIIAHGRRKAYFVYSDGREEPKGYLREAPEKVAKDRGGYTKSLTGNVYWIIEDDYTRAMTTY